VFRWRILLPIIAAVAVVVVLCMGAIGVFDSEEGGSDETTTSTPARSTAPTSDTTAPAEDETIESSPSPTPSFTAPSPNLGSEELGERKHTLFDNKLTMRVPTSWYRMKGTDSSKDVVFADRSDCNESKRVNCPLVVFSSLTDTLSTDLLRDRLNAACVIGERETVPSRPVTTIVNYESISFYRVGCGEGNNARYLWNITSRDVLVTAYPGKNDAVTPELVEAVVQRIAWN
jgi:hypothetical protein